MKKIIYLLMAAVLITSCSNKFSVVKRKYNKGYYFSSTKNKHTETKEALTHKVAGKSIKSASQPIKAAEVIVANSQKEQSIQNQVTETSMLPLPDHSKKVNREQHSTITASVKKEAPMLKKEIKKLPAQLSKAIGSGKGNSDTNTILLVILSLFPILALIAIYLKDGKDITLNFWIDLILHFIALYWLFAILVVLDIINLAK